MIDGDCVVWRWRLTRSIRYVRGNAPRRPRASAARLTGRLDVHRGYSSDARACIASCSAEGDRKTFSRDKEKKIHRGAGG